MELYIGLIRAAIPEFRSRWARSVVLALPLKNDAFLERSRRIERRILRQSLRAGTLSFRCSIGLCPVIGRGKPLRLPPDAGGDRFLGGGMFLSVSLGRGFNRVGGLDCLDLLGQFRNAQPFLFPWLLGRT